MKIGSIVIRCHDFDKMSAFWQQALHYVPREPAKGGWVVLRDPAGRGPNVSLDQVPAKRTGKRSRLHLDLYTNNQEREVARLINIGAVRYPWRHRPGDDFVVLADPDDNLFCVVQVRGDVTPKDDSYERRLISSGSPYEPRIGISRAVRVGPLIAVSGTAPLGPDGRTVAKGNAAAQARRCLEIIKEALERADASLAQVVRTRTLLVRIEDWQSVASVHGEFFGSIRPANTVMQVSGFIDPDWLVEFEADAVIDTRKPSEA